ncbi:unnamed protein product, partial [Amoebophrya sp. A25]
AVTSATSTEAEQNSNNDEVTITSLLDEIRKRASFHLHDQNVSELLTLAEQAVTEDHCTSTEIEVLADIFGLERVPWSLVAETRERIFSLPGKINCAVEGSQNAAAAQSKMHRSATRAAIAMLQRGGLV